MWGLHLQDPKASKCGVARREEAALLCQAIKQSRQAGHKEGTKPQPERSPTENQPEASPARPTVGCPHVLLLLSKLNAPGIAPEQIQTTWNSSENAKPKHSLKFWNYMVQWSQYAGHGGRFCVPSTGAHTFLIHFKHIKKSPKRFHFLSKESYKRECEMGSFSPAKWNTFMFYSCKVKTPFLCCITNWICSCKLLY